MNQVHYLEPDEEITKVINRIRQSEEDGVVLVVPRNSTLTQSVINLKLLKRSAIEHKKAIGLVSTDRITKNLAEQLQVKVFSQVAEAEKAMLIFETPVSASSQKDDSSLKVNTYRKYDLSKMNENERNGERGTGNEEPESDIIKLSKKPLEAEGAVYDPSDSTSSSAEATEDRQNKPEFDDEPIEQRNEEQGTRNGETEEEIKSVPAENVEKDDDISYRSGSYKGKHLRTSGSRKPLLILFSSILVILAIIVGLFWPSAQATVTLKTADAEQKATILVDQNQKGFDSANNILNGTMVELEKSVSKSFNSTGKKDVGAIASGTITISNSTTKNVPISPNTKVTATDGKFFSIVTGVMVPAGSVDTSNCKSNPNGTVECSVIPGTVDAKVTASASGDGYNMAVNTKFTVLSMTATNKAAFTGGVTKNIAFVSETDFTDAETALKAQALADNKAELLDNATKSNLKVLDKYINMAAISFSADKKTNDEADTFAATLLTKLSILGFSESDLRAAMIILASSKLDSDTMLVNPDKSELTYVVSDYSADTNVLKLDVDFKAKTGAKMSENTLKKNLTGKSAGSAQSYLENQAGVASVSIKSSPSFWRTMPFIKNRIKVNFDYQK